MSLPMHGARNVLVVEDTDVCAATLEIALGAVPGVAVECVRTAEEALDRLARGPVSALVTDLHLPAMDGFDLIERVRHDPALARLPVVVISGDADPEAPRRAFRAGANAFFPKPYSPLEVRMKLEELIDAA